MATPQPLWQSVDAYIESAHEEARPHMRIVRAVICAAAPEAEELIRYGMAAYHFKGRPLIYFAGEKRHLGLHPGSEAVAAFAAQLEGYIHTKGGIHFPYARPVDEEFVRRLVEFNMAKIVAGQGKKGKSEP